MSIETKSAESPLRIRSSEDPTGDTFGSAAGSTPETGPSSFELGGGTGAEAAIYGHRFSASEERTRALSWVALSRDYFQRFVSGGDVVVDVGAGDGHLLRNIRAGRKVAVDLSPHVLELEQYGIEVLQIPATQLSEHFQSQADVVFMSNFLEHLPNKHLLLDVLREARKALKEGGMLVILQPNIRFVGRAYWDYIDHHIALTHHCLREALQVTGFEVVKEIPRFLPYTAKSTLGRLVARLDPETLMRWYLSLPFLWRIFGQQSLLVASPRR